VAVRPDAIGRRALLAFVVLVLTGITGCAGRTQSLRTPTDLAEPGGLPAQEVTCEVLSGFRGADWYSSDGGENWVERGSYFVVCRSESGAGSPGEPEDTDEPTARNLAMQGALEQAYGYAFERLEFRGIRYGQRKLAEMVRDKAASRARGEDVDFPRLTFADAVEERCSSTSERGDTYRASVLAEYPIASLRGDVNNARWRAERVANEASVLASSARGLLDQGRWFDATIELSSALDLLASVNEQPDVLEAQRQISELIARVAGALSVEPLDEVQVLEIGERKTVELGFVWTYRWNGRDVRAAHLPVRFEPRGFEAVFDNDSETDEDGAAVCRVVVAFGTPGECFLEPVLDRGVMAGALGDVYDDKLFRVERKSVPVFLVAGSHSLTACIEVDGLGRADEAQLVSGFTRRMELDGFRVEECGSDVDIVVTVGADIRSSGSTGAGATVTVRLDASAFDQRIASVIGSPAIVVRECEPEVRDSEVLALKEAGRLLAAYLHRRALLSGG